jgi:hypothetical protein
MVLSASNRQPLPLAGSYKNFDRIYTSDKPDITRLCLSHLGVVHCRRSKDDEIRGRSTELTKDRRGTAGDAPPTVHETYTATRNLITTPIHHTRKAPTNCN